MAYPCRLRVEISSDCYFFFFSIHTQSSSTFRITLTLRIILLDPVIPSYFQLSSIQFHQPGFLNQISFYLAVSSIYVICPCFHYHTSFHCQSISIQVHRSYDFQRISFILYYNIFIQIPVADRTLHCDIRILEHRVFEVTALWRLKADLLRSFPGEHYFDSICLEVFLISFQLCKVPIQCQRSCTKIVASIGFKRLAYPCRLRVEISSDCYFFFFSIHTQSSSTFRITLTLRIILLDPVIPSYFQLSSIQFHQPGFLNQISFYLAVSSIYVICPCFHYHTSFHCQSISIQVHRSYDFQRISFILYYNIFIQIPVADRTLHCDIRILEHRVFEVAALRCLKADLLCSFPGKYHLCSPSTEVCRISFQLREVPFQCHRSRTKIIIS